MRNAFAAIHRLGWRYPTVRRFVNEEDIRFLQNGSTPLKDGDKISIVPEFAGGLTPIRLGGLPRIAKDAGIQG